MLVFACHTYQIASFTCAISIVFKTQTKQHDLCIIGQTLKPKRKNNRSIPLYNPSLKKIGGSVNIYCVNNTGARWEIGTALRWNCPHLIGATHIRGVHVCTYALRGALWQGCGDVATSTIAPVTLNQYYAGAAGACILRSQQRNIEHSTSSRQRQRHNTPGHTSMHAKQNSNWKRRTGWRCTVHVLQERQIPRIGILRNGHPIADPSTGAYRDTSYLFSMLHILGFEPNFTLLCLKGSLRLFGFGCLPCMRDAVELNPKCTQGYSVMMFENDSGQTDTLTAMCPFQHVEIDAATNTMTSLGAVEWQKHTFECWWLQSRRAPTHCHGRVHMNAKYLAFMSEWNWSRFLTNRVILCT